MTGQVWTLSMYDSALAVLMICSIFSDFALPAGWLSVSETEKHEVWVWRLQLSGLNPLFGIYMYVLVLRRWRHFIYLVFYSYYTALDQIAGKRNFDAFRKQTSACFVYTCPMLV
ncbi:hypothetical protein B0T19DRAFT_103535 [Cercophora scortea]|uniref:Uncharacterized protein n=1 Tax=Cercophora scortea TaxID=314031 RepID=A0AAE0IWI4_9PEZI|nr:hypothetical protein B0T19DRAFT_103535 [Cercophora scortea]